MSQGGLWPQPKIWHRFKNYGTWLVAAQISEKNVPKICHPESRASFLELESM